MGTKTRRLQFISKSGILALEPFRGKPVFFEMLFVPIEDLTDVIIFEVC
jgi:hypothetical protein